MDVRRWVVYSPRATIFSYLRSPLIVPAAQQERAGAHSPMRPERQLLNPRRLYLNRLAAVVADEHIHLIEHLASGVR